jgi:hypothetical protein
MISSIESMLFLSFCSAQRIPTALVAPTGNTVSSPSYSYGKLRDVTKREFSAIGKDLQDIALELSGTENPALRHSLLRDMKILLEEADQVLLAKHTAPAVVRRNSGVTNNNASPANTPGESHLSESVSE